MEVVKVPYLQGILMVISSVFFTKLNTFLILIY